MTVKYSPYGNHQFFDENGDPAVGWKLYAYRTLSSNLQTTYTSADGLTAQTNPIILDALGFPETGQIWLTANKSYRFVLKDENDVTKDTQDNITGVNDTTSTVTQWQSAGTDPTYVSATSYTVSGDQTTEFHVGRRQQFTTTAGTVYGVITNSVYAPSLTTVTVRMDSGQVLDSGLSAVSHSILRADNPAIPIFVFNGKLGADIASAATIDLTNATGNNPALTGSVAVTAVTLAEGLERTVRTTGTPTFAHSATLIVPGGVLFQAMAGDLITFVGYASGVVRITNISRFNGSPVIASNVNDFRLTLETGVPVSTTDQTAKTTIYLTQYKGNKISLYDGTSWSTFASAEVSVAVPATTVTMYDIFAFQTAGVLALQLVAWTNDTTRAAALAYQDGVLVRSANTTRRYLGSFRTTGVSGQTEDSEDKRFLWNYSNRVRKVLFNPFTTARTTTSATLVELNSEIRNEVVIGISEDVVSMTAAGTVSNSAAFICTTSIGINGTTAQRGTSRIYSGATDSETFPVVAHLDKLLAIGYSYITLLGATSGGTGTWTGDASDEMLRCSLQTTVLG